MIGRDFVFLSLAVTAPALSRPGTSPLLPVQAATQLFESDWVLMNWALKYHDADGNIRLDPNEAEAAAIDFRKLADANGDGRVTPDEYRMAREFILARD